MSIAIPEDIQQLLEGDFDPVAAIEIIVRGCSTAQYTGGPQKFFEENPGFKERISNRLTECDDEPPFDEDSNQLFLQWLEIGLRNSASNDKFVKSFADSGDTICCIELSKGDDYHMRMKMLNNSVIIDVLETYYGDEELISSNPNLPKNLLQAIFYQRRMGSSAGDLWVQRDNDVDQRYSQFPF